MDQFCHPSKTLDSLYTNGVIVSCEEWMKGLAERDKETTSALNDHMTKIGRLDDMVDTYCMKQDLPTGICNIQWNPSKKHTLRTSL